MKKKTKQTEQNILKAKKHWRLKYYRNKAKHNILINVNEQNLGIKTKRLSGWLTKQKPTVCYILETHLKQISIFILLPIPWLLVHVILFSIVKVYNVYISFGNLSFLCLFLSLCLN